MDLSTIIDASIQRWDVGPNVRVVVTLNLAGGEDLRRGLFPERRRADL